jgi:hypothetical protein
MLPLICWYRGKHVKFDISEEHDKKVAVSFEIKHSAQNGKYEIVQGIFNMDSGELKKTSQETGNQT